MKRKIALSLSFIITLTVTVNLSIKRNYAVDNQVTYNTKEKQEIKYEKSNYNQSSNMPLGLVSIKKKDKDGFESFHYGYVDKTGKLAIPYQFIKANQFSDGLALVHYFTDESGYIDKTGKLVIPYQFDIAYEFGK